MIKLRNCATPKALLTFFIVGHFADLAQDCSNSTALAMELPQSCTKPSILSYQYRSGMEHVYGDFSTCVVFSWSYCDASYIACI